jgi:hypothetical protein
MELVRRSVRLMAPRGIEAKAQLIHALLTPAEALAQTGESGVHSESRKVIACLHEPVTARSLEAMR